MLLLTKGQTSEQIIVTLNEKRTLDTGFYLFRFVHMVTKEVVNVVYSFLDDDSDFQDRYNQFEINTDTVFDAYSPGFWKYLVYEQASAVNTDPTGLTLVERGMMKLLPETEFEFEKYEETTSYKMYNG